MSATKIGHPGKCVTHIKQDTGLVQCRRQPSPTPGHLEQQHNVSNREEKEGRKCIGGISAQLQTTTAKCLFLSEKENGGTAWHARSHVHQGSSFPIFRLSNQDPTKLCLSSRPTPGEQKALAFLFHSRSHFLLLLVPS